MQDGIIGLRGTYWRTPINFSNYISQLVKIGLCSSLALGITIGLALLLTGGTTAEIDLTLEFGALDGFWFVIGVPVFILLIGLVLSPLSYGIYRLPSMFRKSKPQDEDRGSGGIV